MYRTLIKIFFISLSISSCTDSSKLSNGTLIKSIYLNDVINRVYTYHEDLTLESTKRYDKEGKLSSTNKYEFQNDTLVSFFFDDEQELVSYRKFYFLTDTSFIREGYSANGERDDYWIYYNEMPDCSFSLLEIFNKDGTLSLSYSFKYESTFCNEVATRLNDGEIRIEERIRDGKKNYRPSIRPFFNFESIGNDVKFTVKDEFGKLISSYESVYIYNDNELPISEHKTDNEGNTRMYRYEYY